MRIRYGWLPAVVYFILFLFGCDETEVRQASELDNSRILALRVTPHELDLTAPVASLAVEVIDYVAEGSARYAWTFCASAGAVTRFECLPELPQIQGVSEERIWEIPFVFGDVTLDDSVLTTDFSDWVADPCPDHELLECTEDSTCPLGSLCVKNACRSLTELYPIEFVVKVQPTYNAEEGIIAAVDIPMKVGASPNQDIRLESIAVNDQVSERLEPNCESTVSVTQAAETLELVATVSEASLDSYSVSSDSGCVTEDESAIGIVSWYATEGDFDKSISDLTDPSNRLALDPGVNSVTLFVVARDGRGTLDTQCLKILRESVQQ